MRTLVLALAALTTYALPSGAQIGRLPPRPKQPSAWTSFSVGVMQLSAVQDGTTQSEWQFGNAVQYRITLEMPIQNQSTIGISGAFARVPLTYFPLAGNTSSACLSECDADATVTQLVATLHMGGGAIGLHQVIDLSAGAIGYSSFRARQTGEKLPPTTLDADLALAVGYGIGYSMSPEMQINFVPEASLTVHQRTGVAGGESTIGRQLVWRLGVRFAF